jgi:hypothetical protein
MEHPLEALFRWLEPMRRPEPTRICPTLADVPALPAPEPGHMPVHIDDVVHIDLAAMRRIRLEVRAHG